MNDPRCFDCNLELRPPEGTPEDAVTLCTRDWNERYRKNRFDEMPVGMNFGKTMKLTIHGRPAVWAPRAIVQTQNGMVRWGRRG